MTDSQEPFAEAGWPTPPGPPDHPPAGSGGDDGDPAAEWTAAADAAATREAATREAATREAATREAAVREDEAVIEAAVAAIEGEEDSALASVARERDEYLDALRRLQADFENYKKRMVRQQTQHLERAAAGLVEKLLRVFDTADLAIAHGGGEEVKQVWTALFDTLEQEGLERIDPSGAPFDPTVHEAVAHEPGDGAGQPEVVEVMRAGYRWKGRVLRPAMVKVRG